MIYVQTFFPCVRIRPFLYRFKLRDPFRDVLSALPEFDKRRELFSYDEVRHCKLNFDVVRHCKLNFDVVRHCKLILKVVRHCKLIFDLVRHC